MQLRRRHLATLNSFFLLVQVDEGRKKKIVERERERERKMERKSARKSKSKSRSFPLSFSRCTLHLIEECCYPSVRFILSHFFTPLLILSLSLSLSLSVPIQLGSNFISSTTRRWQTSLTQQSAQMKCICVRVSLAYERMPAMMKYVAVNQTWTAPWTKFHSKSRHS